MFDTLKDWFMMGVLLVAGAVVSLFGLLWVASVMLFWPAVLYLAYLLIQKL